MVKPDPAVPTVGVRGAHRNGGRGRWLAAIAAALLLTPVTAQADTWTRVADMTRARVAFSAVTLNDGRVLVAGGDSLGGATATAEIFDAVAGTWTATPPMATARSRAQAVVLRDGRVLVVGGRSAQDSALASSEIYDPATGAWTAAASMRTPRDNHGLALLPDGRVLAMGGGSWTPDAQGITVEKSAELYDPATDSWVAAPSMANARFQVRPVVLDDGRVLVSGGFDPAVNHNPYQTVEIFDAATMRWSNAHPMLEARAMHRPTVLDDGRVLVAGGLTRHSDFGVDATAGAELFDPSRNVWRRAPSLAQERGNLSSTLLPDGRVLITSGNDDGFFALRTTEIYDPVSNTLTLGPALHIARVGPAAAPLRDGRVLVVGGNGGRALGFEPIAAAEVFTPSP